MKEKAGRNVPIPQLQENVNFVIKETKNVCKNIGPRAPGSENEKKGHDYFASLMKNYADSVEQDEFSLSPKAFMGWVIPASVSMFISAVLFALCNLNVISDVFYLPLKIVSFLLALFAVICMLMQFVFNKKFLDKLFKKATSTNTICRRKPNGEIKKKIILSGHMDSAFECRYTGKLLRSIVMPTLLFAFLSMGIDIAAIFFKSDFIILVFSIIQLVICIWFLLILFTSNFKKAVPGALDNLTGVFTAGALMRYLSENDIRFEDAEVIVLATGGKEAGLRGAMDFAEKHQDELKAAETVFIGLDTLAEKEHLCVNTKDMNATVNHLVSESAKNVGYDIPFSKISFVATDASAMTRAGIAATTITAMDPSPAKYYHTRHDTPELLQRDVIEETIRICIETVYQFAEG